MAIINKLDKSNNNGITEELNITEFTQFFKDSGSVISKLKNNSHHENILKNLSFLLKNPTNDDSKLNGPIQENEITKAVRRLKNGKSCASDLIANEMIKHGMPVILNPLHKLFNIVYESGSFPKSWNESLITLLHKKGNKYNPSNYRGISITSNLGKRFNKIMHNRLLEFVYEHNLKLHSKNSLTHLIIFSHSSPLLNIIKCQRKKFMLHL